MRIKFHGPLDRVTGSCYELHEPLHNQRFLIDCGMRQGDPTAEAANAGPLPFDPSALDFMVLTHAHIDHCGLIPRLYREGFKGTVYCTRETGRLAQLVLTDAARQPGAAFNEADVEAIRWHEPARAVFSRHCSVAPNLFLRFHRTSHLPGACAISVVWGSPPRPGQPGQQRSITFSGDLGPNTEENEHLPLMRFRMDTEFGEYCVVESTYGGVIRPADESDADARLARLGQKLDGVMERGGLAILPCFALGRTQDVLFDLHALYAAHPDRYGHIPVYLDSPMGHQANLIFADALARTQAGPTKVRPAWLAKALFARFGLDKEDPADAELLVDCLKEMLIPWHRPSMPRRAGLASWRRIWRDGRPLRNAPQSAAPGILVTGGGMCDGGPVQTHLAAHLPNPTTTVLLTGYCGPSTVGGRLQALAGLPADQRRHLTEPLVLSDSGLRLADVRARVERLTGYSAHADEPGLVEWVLGRRPDGTIKPPTHVFISHGDAGPRRALAAALGKAARDRGFDLTPHLPVDAHDWFDLDAGRWDETRSTEDLLRARIADLEARLAAVSG